MSQRERTDISCTGLFRRCSTLPPITEVSVIVCTRNRADSLTRCLRSLVADPSVTPAEIIVVDNASHDRTPAVVCAASKESARPFASTWTSDVGLSRARNCGIQHARGSLLLFTDDDVTVEPGWIDAMAAAFTPGVAAVGGRILPRFVGEVPAWLRGYASPATLIDFGDVGFEMSADRLPLGANMGFDGSILRALLPEPFSPRLGHNGRVGVGWEETHLLLELVKTSRIVYTPDARVEHWIDAERWTYPAMRRSFYQLGVGLGRHERLRGAPLPSVPRRAVRVIRCLGRADQLRRQNARTHAVTSANAEAEFKAFMWAGLHVELLFGGAARLSDLLVRFAPWV